MPKQVKWLLVALGAFVVLALLGGLVFVRNDTATGPALPNPNGFDDLIRAGAVVTRDVSDYPTLDHDGLRQLVATNSEALRLLRQGLSRQCCVPLDSAMTNIGGMVSDLGCLKRLAQLLAAEGRLREMDRQPAEAARSYLDIIRFGDAISRGGLVINRLVGIACEAIGCTPLAKLAPGLDGAAAGQVVVALEDIDHNQVTWDEVRRNERKYINSQLRQSRNPLWWIMAQWQGWNSMRKAESRHNRLVARLRLLTAELALRRFQADKASLPPNLEQLLPNYLTRVPMDPFTGQPLVYRPQGTTWLLYSVGPDGVDNGGQPPGRGPATKGDVSANSPW